MEPIDANLTNGPKETVIDFVSNLDVVNRDTLLRERLDEVLRVTMMVSIKLPRILIGIKH